MNNNIGQIIGENSISIVFFLIFLIVQLCFFIPTLRYLWKLSSIFPKNEYEKAEDEDGIVHIISSSDNDGVFKSICHKINRYIKENSDSIDLAEMKDIANRLTDIECEKATAKISYPMYIGLMGTYFGVGWGLLELIMSMGKNEEKMFDTNAIYVFIGGVVVAMLTSLFGLLFTTVGNNTAVKKETALEHDKDDFFTFLQTQIIPQLPSTLAQTLKEELQKSIGALGETIGALDSTVHSLNSDLKNTFEDIIHKFGENLSHNLTGLQTTVTTLTENAGIYVKTMQKQDDILDKLNSPSFVKALDKINKTVDNCQTAAETISQAEQTAIRFNDLQKESTELQSAILETQRSLIDSHSTAAENIVRIHTQLSDITINSQERLNQLMSEPNRLFEYIKDTLDQFKKIESFVEMVISQEIDSTADRINYINAQLQQLEDAGRTIHTYINTTKSQLEQYLDSQKHQMQESAEGFVESWNRMFSHMVANGADNPLAYLKLISDLNKKVEDIKGMIPAQKDDSKLYDELNKIHSALQAISKHPNRSTNNTANTTNTVRVVTPDETQKGFWAKLFRR